MLHLDRAQSSAGCSTSYAVEDVTKRLCSRRARSRCPSSRQVPFLTFGLRVPVLWCALQSRDPPDTRRCAALPRPYQGPSSPERVSVLGGVPCRRYSPSARNRTIAPLKHMRGERLMLTLALRRCTLTAGCAPASHRSAPSPRQLVSRRERGHNCAPVARSRRIPSAAARRGPFLQHPGLCTQQPPRLA